MQHQERPEEPGQTRFPAPNGTSAKLEQVLVLLLVLVWVLLLVLVLVLVLAPVLVPGLVPGSVPFPGPPRS